MKNRFPRDHEVMAQCISIIQRIDQTLTCVRRIATELRPSVLDQLGLAAALEWQGQEFGTRTGIKVDMKVSGDGTMISDELGSSVFRILQESLTNIARHAHATRVTIRLVQNSEALILEVTDNGVGIPRERLDPATMSLGLVGMRERALACGGDLSIANGADCGTTVGLKVPIVAGVAP
jgi:signal transduction histidine kinase